MPEKLFSAEAAGKRFAATTSSAATSKSLDLVGTSVRVVNRGPDTAIFAVGDGAQTATVPPASTAVAAGSCHTVLANSDITLGLKSGNSPKEFACFTESGTATLDVYVSNGI